MALEIQGAKQTLTIDHFELSTEILDIDPKQFNEALRNFNLPYETMDYINRFLVFLSDTYLDYDFDYKFEQQSANKVANGINLILYPVFRGKLKSDSSVWLGKGSIDKMLKLFNGSSRAGIKPTKNKNIITSILKSKNLPIELPIEGINNENKFALFVPDKITSKDGVDNNSKQSIFTVGIRKKIIRILISLTLLYGAFKFFDTGLYKQLMTPAQKIHALVHDDFHIEITDSTDSIINLLTV